MPARIAILPRLSLAVLFVASAACADAPAGPHCPAGSEQERGQVLGGARHHPVERTRPGSAGIAATRQRAGRCQPDPLVSLDRQYRAVLAAESGKDQGTHTPVSAAVGAASAVVLSWFFPNDATSIEDHLDAEVAPSWPGGAHEDPVSGEALGRTVGAAVVALAASDNYLVIPVGIPPVGPGFWVSSGAPIIRSAHGVRPFFLSSADQLRPPPPPAFGSPAFLAGLAEVRTISDTRTTEQTAIALFWNFNTGPFTAGALNRTAVELIQKYRRTEREAARILAYANAAAFDAHIACWDAKREYWLLRPSQADPAITLAIALPNHPSYPSGHSASPAP